MFRLTASALVLVLIFVAPVFGQTVMEIRPSPAPNVFGSPSWDDYLDNAMSSLVAGGGAIGNRAVDPTAYVILDGLYMPGDIMVTSFPSWRGLADPPPPFDAELGNRLHFGLAIIGDGTQQFTLQDVLFNLTSSDGALDFSGSLAGTTLNGTTRIGFDYGPDRLPGTGDDIVFNSGEGDTTSMDALIYAGVGQAYWPGGPGDPNTGQTAIDIVTNYILDEGIEVTMVYTVESFATSVETSLLPAIFFDGFESGDTLEWSTIP